MGGGYILEELGVTTSLLDSLELSIGLALMLVELFSPPLGACGELQDSLPGQRTICLMWPYME